MKKTWIIKSLINFPLETIRAPGEKVPKKLKFNSRYDPESSIEMDGVKFYFEKVDDNKREMINGVFNEYVFLVCELYSDTALNAITSAIPYIEWSCDQLSFFSQFPILIQKNEIHCKEEPTETVHLAKPQQPAKFRESWYIGNAVTMMKVPLRHEPENMTIKIRAALRWYHKALAANYEIDRFIFLWICLEILCKEDETSVKNPYVNNTCGHVIDKCPECGASTEKEVNGPTIKEFLIKKLNVSDEDASKLWSFRQILHGKNKFDEDKSAELEHLVSHLCAAVNRGIKRITQLKDDKPPIVIPDAPALSSLGITITKK
ncbi:MAG: hypothetical protein AB2559_04295 [Candidatus Thiodiazotropha endolucinida]